MPRCLGPCKSEFVPQFKGQRVCKTYSTLVVRKGIKRKLTGTGGKRRFNIHNY